jgi:type II secretory pathway pseudopilin PulG
MIQNQIKKQIRKNTGMIIIQVIVFASVVIILIGALSAWAATTIKAGRITFNREQAFQAAEAGIDYYRWHLAHAPTDYQDGTGVAGPYVHNLKDKNNDIIGQFSLDITAPTLGSTLVKIKSTGTSIFDSSYQRKIVSSVAKPSIAKYSVAGNNAMRFGIGTEIFGPVHVNGGIRFDGLAHNIVTSGATTYTDSDGDACTTTNSWGVHTCLSPADPISPTALPSRSDVFEAGRLISQPTINFSGFTTDLATLKSKAQSSGFYRDVAGSGFVGYHIILKTNGTFDLYKINSWASRGNCNSYYSETLSWSVGTQTLQGNYAYPGNGIIFLEDHVVVDGQINGARLTITAADLPVPSSSSGYKNIIINNDILYTAYDGTDSIGLIGQNGVMVGMISDTDLKIDAALIAQNGKVGRFYYNGSSCAYKNRSVISLYGMIASYARYGFAFVDGTGYTTRNITYDSNLLYAPPPDFPLTSDQYQILSWEEVKN